MEPKRSLSTAYPKVIFHSVLNITTARVKKGSYFYFMLVNGKMIGSGVIYHTCGFNELQAFVHDVNTITMALSTRVRVYHIYSP